MTVVRLPLLLILGNEDLEIEYGDYILASREIRGKKRGITIKGPTERLAEEFGIINFIKYAIRDRDTVRKIFNRKLGRVIDDIGRMGGREHPDFIFITDDAASYGGPLLPRWYMEELYIPSHRSISDEIRTLGAEAFLHADGDYGSYFKNLSSIWDVLHPLDIYPRGSLQEYETWLNRLMRIRKDLRCSIATGIPLELGNESDILTAVKQLIRTHGEEGLILSNYHPPLSKLDLDPLLEGIRYVVQ